MAINTLRRQNVVAIDFRKKASYIRMLHRPYQQKIADRKALNLHATFPKFESGALSNRLPSASPSDKEGAAGLSLAKCFRVGFSCQFRGSAKIPQAKGAV